MEMQTKAPLQKTIRCATGIATCTVRTKTATGILRFYSNFALTSSFGRGVHPVFKTIYESLPRGLDDILPDPYCTPHTLAVGGIDEDAGRGGGCPVLVEDAH